VSGALVGACCIQRRLELEQHEITRELSGGGEGGGAGVRRRSRCTCKNELELADGIHIDRGQ
jgi:hypothetical protein